MILTDFIPVLYLIQRSDRPKLTHKKMKANIMYSVDIKVNGNIVSSIEVRADNAAKAQIAAIKKTSFKVKKLYNGKTN